MKLDQCRVTMSGIWNLALLPMGWRRGGKELKMEEIKRAEKEKRKERRKERRVGKEKFLIEGKNFPTLKKLYTFLYKEMKNE